MGHVNDFSGGTGLPPIANSALLAAKLVKHATLKVYPGASHGMCVTLADKVNAELLEFLKA